MVAHATLCCAARQPEGAVDENLAGTGEAGIRHRETGGNLAQLHGVATVDPQPAQRDAVTNIAEAGAHREDGISAGLVIHNRIRSVAIGYPIRPARRGRPQSGAPLPGGRDRLAIDKRT